VSAQGTGNIAEYKTAVFEAGCDYHSALFMKLCVKLYIVNS